MFTLGLGVSRVSDILPLPVYALLSGLNAAVVGVIAFAGVRLAEKAITDPISRLIVVFSACAGLCYTALWYFPLLMAVGGISTVVWDLWGSSSVGKLKGRWRRQRSQDDALESSGGHELRRRSILSTASVSRMQQHGSNIYLGQESRVGEEDHHNDRTSDGSVPEAVRRVSRGIPVKVGLIIMVTFWGMVWSGGYDSRSVY